MLVKRSRVDRWYQTDSWVYRNFAYLFQNPLWSKPVPRGFSVCPYFWLNLFSLLIFRPFFVLPIRYVILPILKLIGKPAQAVDNFLFNFFSKIGWAPSQGHGVGCLLGVVFLLAGSLILCVLGIIAIHVHLLYTKIGGDTTGLFAFWSAASFIGLFVILAAHKLFTDTKCKTMYYLLVWLLLFIPISIAVVPHEVVAIISGLGAVVWELIKLIGTGLGIILHGIAVGCLWTWKWIVVVFSWKPIDMLILPWWGFLIIFSIVGLLTDKITGWLDKRNVAAMSQESPDKLYAYYRNVWVDKFVSILLLGKRWANNQIVHESFDSYTAPVVRRFRHEIFRQTFEKMWGDALNKLQTRYPVTQDGITIDLSSGYTDVRFENFRQALQNSADVPKMDVERFIEIMKDVVKNDPEIQRQCADAMTNENLKRKKQEEKQSSWSHVTCLKVTNFIADSFKSTVRGIRKGFKFTFSNIGTFLAYMWMLIKAKKQGACPYITFTNPSDITISKNEKSDAING